MRHRLLVLLIKITHIFAKLTRIQTAVTIVFIAVALPSGAQDGQMELNDDGNMVVIRYNWTKTFINMEDMFKKELAAQQISIHHPKVLCVQNGLEKVRSRIDLAPEAFIEVNLPITVQTSTDSWTKSGLKRDDGTQMVMAEFKGCFKNCNKKVDDAKITFDG